MTVDTTGLREQVAKKQDGGGKTIKQIIEEQKPQIARALPKIVSPDRFTRLVLTELSRTPKLQECSAASLLGALMYAAGLGVEPGPLGHAYIVPYGKDVTFILGYKGMLELARRSGKILDIQARAVYSNDVFSFEYGLEDKLIHRPTLGDPGEAVAFYGVARFIDGGHYFLVLSKAEVDRRRGRSAAKNKGPWVTDYDAMARKTVIRAMAPFLPLTPEIATAIEQDEIKVDFDPDAQEEPLEITEMHDESPPEGAPPALAGGGGKVEDVGAEQPDAVGEVSEASPAPASTTETPNVIINRDSDATVEELAGERPPPDNYDRLTAVELEEELRKRHLPMSGNRDVKADRLREHDRELEAPM